MNTVTEASVVTATPPTRPAVAPRFAIPGRSNPDDAPEAPARVILPSVRVPVDGVSISASARELFTVIAAKQDLFYRGGMVVRLIQEEGQTAVEPLRDEAAQSCFEKYVRFTKRRKAIDMWLDNPVNITKAMAKQYLASDECRQLLPRLKGLVNCPVLVEREGAIHQVNIGFDPATGLYVANQSPVEELNLAEAVKRLNFLLAEFDFKTAGDRSRALMSFLTPALKFGGFIKGPIPIEVAEANESQSGKSYRQQLVAAVYHEKLGVVTRKSGGVGSMEETFQSHLVSGKAFIQLDNVRGKLDSQLVEAFITANGPFATRVPYHGNVDVDPSKHMIFISSNGFESTKDLANRSCIVRINKRADYNYPLINGNDLATHAFEHHVDYLAAVFAVIRHWHAAGKPRTAETRHDLREWCQVGDWIVVNVFNSAALMDGHDEAKQRASNTSLGFFRNLAVKLEVEGRLNQQLSATNLADFCEEADVVIPNLSEANSHDPKQRRAHIGKLMRAVLDGAGECGRVWEGYRVVAAEANVLNASGQPDTRTHYTVTKVESA
jgi:hypothetical protein